ncbi:MAG: WGR domain-containing protein [Myxococcales bacterium]
MPRFERGEGDSRRFWEIEREGAVLTLDYGQGAERATRVRHSFESETAAQETLDKLVQEKVAQGYVCFDSLPSDARRARLLEAAGTSLEMGPEPGRARIVYGTDLAGPEFADVLRRLLADSDLRIDRLSASLSFSTDFASIAAGLARCREARWLETLTACTFDEAEAFFGTRLELDGLPAAFGGLRTLQLQAGSLAVDRLGVPGLRQLQLRSAGMDRRTLAMLGREDWPELTSLGLWLGSPRLGCDVQLEDLSPLLVPERFPKLRKLAVWASPFGSDLAEAVTASPLVAQLESLDLSLGTLGKRAAQHLRANAATLAHLRRLDLTLDELRPRQTSTGSPGSSPSGSSARLAATRAASSTSSPCTRARAT